MKELEFNKTLWWLKRGLLCLSVWTCTSVSAQIKGEWYLKNVLDNSNGLPQNSIGSMYFDAKTGFLWLTTESGLVRYDGVEPFVFDKRKLPGLKTGRMTNFFSTVQEGIFAMEKYGGVFCTIDGSDIHEYKGFKINAPEPLYGMFRGSFTSLPQINEIFDNWFYRKIPLKKYILYGSPISILAFPGKKWLTYSEDSLKVYTGSKLAARWKKSVHEIPILINSGDKGYALNDDGSGYCIDPVSLTCKRIICLDTTFSRGKPVIFYDDINKQPLLLNRNKLYRIRFSGDSVFTDYVATLDNLPNSIESILIHPGGKLIFVSTLLNGLSVYEKNPFRTYKAEGILNVIGRIDLLRNNIYTCVMPDSNHIITSTSVSININTGKVSYLPFVNTGRIAMMLDSNQDIWHQSVEKLVKYNVKSGKTEIVHFANESYNIAKEPISAMLQLPGRRQLLSSKHFLCYTENEQIVKTIEISADKIFDPDCLATDKKGRLYAGTTLGMYLVDTVKKQYVLLEKVKAKSVRNIYIDPDQHCWISTYGNGFFMYDLTTEQFYSFPVDSKGYLLFCHVFCEDGKGNFLIPTNRGLFRISKSHLLNIAYGKEKNLFYQYFDTHSGLEGNEFNGGCYPAYNRHPNGDVFFPSLDGLVRVNISLLPDVSEYPLFINRVDTKNASYPDSTVYNFSKDERSMTWYLGFAQWEQQYSPGLSYKVGNDSNWTYLPDGSRRIQLSELSGGNHTLYIRFKTGFRSNAYSYLTIPFHIEKKYYEYVLFWLFCLALLIVIVYIIVRLQTRNLDKINTRLENKVAEKTKELVYKNTELNEILIDLQETNLFKSRLISLLGHDIMIPLQYIGKVASQLRLYHEQLSKDTITGSVGDIHITSSQILLYCESIIHWVKVQNSKFIPQISSAFSVADMLSELSAFHLPFNNEKSNQLIIEAPRGLSFFQDPLLVKIILHNLLLNANKFTNGGTITVRADKENEWLTLSVEDTGRGMTKEKVLSLNNFNPITSDTGTNEEKGFGVGYTIIMDLLKFSNGTFHVESTINKGTKVTIKLPIYGNDS